MSKVIGVGAAGNKAVIQAINDEVLTKEMTLLINSTLKDISLEYRQESVNIGGVRGGCGKERSASKELVTESFKDGTLEVLDSILHPDDEDIHLVTSSEGGTGSGAVPTIAKYYKDVYNINVHIWIFTGFEDDVRGMKNTVDLFKDLSDDYIIHAISNKKFLDEANGNKIKAHQLANKEFSRQINILLGNTIVDSQDNIDETDLYKVVNTTGYQVVAYSSLDRTIKNTEQFNKVITNMIDESKNIDVINPGMQRLGVILNIKESTSDIIDYGFEAIKSKYGVPVEVFSHIQFEGNTEFINIIASGMRLPKEEIVEIYDRYKENIQKVNRSKDSFFDEIGELEDESMSSFNTARRALADKNTKSNKNKFLSSLGIEKDSNDIKDEIKSKREDFINNQY